MWAFKPLPDLSRPISAASSPVGASHVGAWLGVDRASPGSSEATMAPKRPPGTYPVSHSWDSAPSTRAQSKHPVTLPLEKAARTLEASI